MGFWDKLGDLSGIFGLAGDLFGASSAEKAQRSANKANLANSREQRAWEAQMANTAVQRRKQDVTAAGFNPLLAVTGPGAATPSVSPPSMEPTFKSEWTKGSVKEAMMAKVQMDSIKAATNKAIAETGLTTAQTGIAAKTSLLLDEQTKQTVAATGASTAQTEHTRKQIEILDQAKLTAIQQLSNLVKEGDLRTIELEIANATKEEAKQIIRNNAKASAGTAARGQAIEKVISSFDKTTQTVGTWIGETAAKAAINAKKIVEKATTGAPRNTGKTTPGYKYKTRTGR